MYEESYKRKHTNYGIVAKQHTEKTKTNSMFVSYV